MPPEFRIRNTVHPVHHLEQPVAAGAVGLPGVGTTASDIGFIDSLVPEDEQAQVTAAMAAAAQSADAQVIQLDHRLRAADGTDRWYSRRITAMRRDHRGRVTEVVGVLRDITAATAAEQNLRHFALHDSLPGKDESETIRPLIG